VSKAPADQLEFVLSPGNSEDLDMSWFYRNFFATDIDVIPDHSTTEML